MLLEQPTTRFNERETPRGIEEETRILERYNIFDDPVVAGFENARAAYSQIRSQMSANTDLKARIGVGTAMKRFEAKETRNVLAAQTFQILAHQLNMAVYSDGSSKAYRKTPAPDGSLVLTCDHTLDVGLGAMGVEVNEDGSVYDNSGQCLRPEAAAAAHVHDVPDDVMVLWNGTMVRKSELFDILRQRWGDTTTTLVEGLSGYEQDEMPEGLERALATSTLTQFIYEQTESYELDDVVKIREDIKKAFAGSHRIFETAHRTGAQFNRTAAELTHIKGIDVKSNGKTPGISNPKLIRAQSLLVMLRIMGDPLANRYLETLSERGLNVADPAHPLREVKEHAEIIARRAAITQEEQEAFAQLNYELFGVESERTSVGYPITLSDENLIETSQRQESLILGIQHTFVMTPQNVGKMWNATTGYGRYQLNPDQNQQLSHALQQPQGQSYGVIEVDGVIHRLIQNGGRKSWMYALVNLDTGSIVRYLKFVDDKPTLFDAIRYKQSKNINLDEIPEGYIFNPYDGIDDGIGEVMDRISFLHNPLNVRRAKKLPVAWGRTAYANAGMMFAGEDATLQEIYAKAGLAQQSHYPLLVKPGYSDIVAPPSSYSKRVNEMGWGHGVTPDLILFQD